MDSRGLILQAGDLERFLNETSVTRALHTILVDSDWRVCFLLHLAGLLVDAVKCRVLAVHLILHV